MLEVVSVDPAGENKTIHHKNDKMSSFLLRKGLFAGSGSAAFNEWPICHAVLQLTGRFDTTTKTLTAPVVVLYLGTASYDLEGPFLNQTQKFRECGCEIVNMAIALQCPPASHTADRWKDEFQRADVVIVSGGNTLYAMRRWAQLGVDVLLREAASRGVVMSGGSAGAICWFDGGHSDSMDPETYVQAMVNTTTTSTVTTGTAVIDEASTGDLTAAPKQWSYIRVTGLGLLPGLLCPHHDRVQSNGVLRAVDFDGMLQRHRGERGVAIDHWAALVVNEETFSVVSLEGKEGSGKASIGAGGDKQYVADGTGVPSVWIKEIKEPAQGNGDDEGLDDRKVVHWTAVPEHGMLSWLLRQAKCVEADPREERCANENPIPVLL